MALHAIDDVSDALPVTTDFLRGLSKRDWLLLAVVALLTGGASNTTSGGSNVGNVGGGGSGTPVGTPDVGNVLATIPGWVWGVVALLVLLGLVLAVLGAILQFTFIEALCTGDVEIRRTVAAHWGKGVRLFGFNLVLGVVVLALFAVAVLPLLLGIPGGAFFLLFIPVAILLALFVALVLGFTRAFVVPVMLVEDAGVLAAWRRFWSALVSEPVEYLVFAVVNFVLLIILGIALGIAAVVVGIAVLVPVGIVFGIPFALAGASGVLAWTWLTVGIVVGGLLFLLGIGLVSVPVQSYLRYYALLLLGDTDPELDLIPERRAAVREDDDEDGESGDESDDDGDGPGTDASESTDDSGRDADAA